MHRVERGTGSAKDLQARTRAAGGTVAFIIILNEMMILIALLTWSGKSGTEGSEAGRHLHKETTTVVRGNSSF